MKNSKLILPAAVAVCAMLGIGAAFAADLPVQAPIYKAAPVSATLFNWTGFYAGLNAGYGWGEGSTVFTSRRDGIFSAGLAAGAIPNSFPPRMRGFVGGGQAGYNFQSGQAVFGIETDISFADLHGTSTVPSPLPFTLFPTVVTTQNQKLDWFGTLRGRFGFLVSPAWLIYGTGGLAFGHTTASTNVILPVGSFAGDCTSNALCGSGSASQTRAGWTVGGGLEFALREGWTAKAEYLYFDLGEVSYSVRSTSAPAFSMGATSKFTGQIVRVGLNYKFGDLGKPPVVAKY